MRSRTRALAVVALTFGVGGLLADDKKQPAGTPPAKPVTDAEFVVIAASSGTYEVTAGKMAKERAAGDAVKKFADQMVTDHTKANTELMAVAKKAGLGLPVQMMELDARQLQILGTKAGAEFDREFIAQQVKAHDDAVALFENASKNAKNADLKDFATKTLPTLKEHQKHARMLAKGGGGTGKDKPSGDKDKGAPDKEE